MSDAEDKSPELDERELAALARWPAETPSVDFADRVLERIDAVETVSSPRASRRAFAVAAGVLLVAGIGAAALLRGPGAASGELDVTARTTFAIGARGTGVAEGGTALEYEVDAFGAARVAQNSGNVFYRVERGGPFVVATPLGEARVTGTSFRVEVMDMNGKTAGALGAAAGAFLASTVLVTVYEGSVVTASPSGELALSAGEGARLEKGAAPAKVATALSGAALGANGAVGSAPAGAVDPASLPETLESLKAERIVLRHKLAELEAQIGGGAQKDGGFVHQGPESYDLSPEALKQMAEICELRWDTAGMGEPDTVSRQAIEKLALGAGEQEVINRIYVEQQKALLKVIDQAYAELTGDEGGSLSTQAKLMELEDKVPPGEMKRIFQRLSAERAGLPTQPPTGAMSPTERVFRAMTGSGDALEQAITAELGNNMGRRMRDLKKGWGSKHRSSYGCPEQ